MTRQTLFWFKHPLQSLATSLLLLTLLSWAAAAPKLFVAYPPEGHKVPFDHVILEGSVSPGAKLKINDQTVEVAPDGLFMLWWPLKVGINDLRLVSTLNGQSAQHRHRVTRTVLRVLPSSPTAIERLSVRPDVDYEFWDLAGDSPAERSIPVSFRGSVGGKAQVRLEGGVWQALKEGPVGTYSGLLELSPQAKAQRADVQVRLIGKNGRSVQATGLGHVTVTAQRWMAIQTSGTVRGQGLNESLNQAILLPTLFSAWPTTTPSTSPSNGLEKRHWLYPRDGMTFTAVGRQGQDIRLRLAPGLSVLIGREQISVTQGVPPKATGGLIRIAGAPGSSSSTPEGGFQPAATSLSPVQVRIPLGAARPPFRMQQRPEGLVLELYGLDGPPGADPASQAPPLLTGATVMQSAPGITQVLLSNGLPLGGHTAQYQSGPDGQTELVVTLKAPVQPDPARPLMGRIITLDPGHGGSNEGGAGSFGQREKFIILPIAVRTAELLRAQGATVHLTRTADSTVGLAERGLLAEQTGSEVLVSLHANALPDGRDPRGIRGPEVYYSHLQAEALAQGLLDQLRQRLPELGPGQGLKPDADLALTRPTSQPSVLVELAYLTDPDNLRALHSPEAKERFAQAITGGLGQYFAALASR